MTCSTIQDFMGFIIDTENINRLINRWFLLTFGEKKEGDKAMLELIEKVSSEIYAFDLNSEHCFHNELLDCSCVSGKETAGHWAPTANSAENKSLQEIPFLSFHGWFIGWSFREVLTCNVSQFQWSRWCHILWYAMNKEYYGGLNNHEITWIHRWLKKNDQEIDYRTQETLDHRSS